MGRRDSHPRCVGGPGADDVFRRSAAERVGDDPGRPVRRRQRRHDHRDDPEREHDPAGMAGGVLHERDALGLAGAHAQRRREHCLHVERRRPRVAVPGNCRRDDDSKRLLQRALDADDGVPGGHVPVQHVQRRRSTRIRRRRVDPGLLDQPGAHCPFGEQGDDGREPYDRRRVLRVRQRRAHVLRFRVPPRPGRIRRGGGGRQPARVCADRLRVRPGRAHLHRLPHGRREDMERDVAAALLHGPERQRLPGPGPAGHDARPGFRHEWMGVPGVRARGQHR